MALTTVTLHGQILDLDGLTPAVGTVTFKTLIELNDLVDNVTYQPSTFVATLDVNGEFTIVLPATDNPDISPLNWVYQVYISTATWRASEYVQLPFAPGVTEFADLERLDYDPCAMAFGGVPVPPEDVDLFVRRAGDTMTGPLIINSNLQVNGDANVEGVLTNVFQTTSLDVGLLTVMGMSTAIISGGEITVNAGDPTRIDISAITGYIVNGVNWLPLSPTNPSITYITLPAQVGVLPAFAPITWYRVNSLGALVQQSAFPTPDQRRNNLIIGATATTGLGTNVIVDQTLPVIPSQVNNQLVDLMDALGPFSTMGNDLSPNGVNLTFNKNAGTIFARAFNYIPNFQNPHNSALAAQAPVSFRHTTAVAGTAGPSTAILDVGSYDPNGSGVVTPVPGGVGVATNFRVWGFATNTVPEQILVQYGQLTFPTLAAAVAALPAGVYIPNPATASAALLGWISVIRTATDLSNPAQAVFTKAAKFATP